MINTTPASRERAILIAVKSAKIAKDIVEEHLNELEMLADTAGAETVFKVMQAKNSIDPAYYIGRGKGEELAEWVELNNIDLAIFDADLNPSQVRNLEKLFNRKIVDRSGLILDIFASHAKTQQAKTQVELAQLQYLLPRLTRAWTHLSKQYGGIGTKGPGETQIETDRRLIRTRISALKKKLEKIDSQQKTKSHKRDDFIKASIVGYTNAGKSTLLNILTGSNVLAEDKLFATLDSTTRSIVFDKNKKILISDTVGFIRKLPHNLVASFKSTLDVVRDADIILHVIDITHPYFEEHIDVVMQTLKELNCEKKKTLYIFNKVDSLEDKGRLEYIFNKYPESLVISAVRGFNIKMLRKSLLKVYETNFKLQTLFLKPEDSKLASQIHKYADVVSTEYDHDKVKITYRTDEENLNKIQKLINETK